MFRYKIVFKEENKEPRIFFVTANDVQDAYEMAEQNQGKDEVLMSISFA